MLVQYGQCQPNAQSAQYDRLPAPNLWANTYFQHYHQHGFCGVAQWQNAGL